MRKYLWSEFGGNPDVKVETILGDVSVGVPHLFPAESWESVRHLLLARVRKMMGVENARPWIDLHRFAEAEIGQRRFGERYTEEHVDTDAHGFFV